MRRDTWFKCDPLDLIEGVESCENEAQGLVYVMVLMRIYQSGGPVANNPAAVAALSHMSTRKASAAITDLIRLGKLIETSDGRLFNRRAQGELGDRIRLSETRSSAGKQGGRPKKPSEETIESASKVLRERAESSANARDNSEKPAENGHSPKPKAFHARVREEQIREESPPTPPGADGDGQMPDQPMTDAERAEAAAKIASIAERAEVPEGAVQRVVGEVMRRAKMTAPPVDLVLIETWLAKGIDEELILDTVTRMAAGARGPIRQMRYFDAELRRQHEAKGSAEEADIAHFRKIAARARAP